MTAAVQKTRGVILLSQADRIAVLGAIGRPSAAHAGETEHRAEYHRCGLALVVLLAAPAPCGRQFLEP